MNTTHPFYLHFEKIYGDRWPALFAALQKGECQVARKNLLSASIDQDKAWSAFEQKPELPNCYWIPEGQSAHPQRNSDEMLDVYVMDPASVMVARALEVQEGDRVLDMCAAPGGKSLVMIEALKEAGEIFCNDLSPERRERLKKVIQQYVPRSIRDRVWVTGKDGVQFGLKEADTYDRVLLDAPCSGERHILENPTAQAEWSPRRTEHLASRQYSLLAAALLAVKPGGRIVYSTCSISPAENDEVIRKLLKKKKDAVRLLEAPLGVGGERTEFGVAYMPDHSGFGPLYFAVIEKN
ncbi:RsmB/NOP family class I SAM-dependent RNA methyltransferase [Bdellovibrio svalbardensis]|uniref:NOL1/NOP2/Sun domain family member 4 n=1 Tax=Bdellovibrio svalbardensis TaxID=2972972 RepID=A0ABT6DMY5_9BACT|nr:RsmB/NOP family class I SAM-dependent RNA methyltransferase [Bdellovibrio svalbardensis]MDG0817974.1 RsmB/NOP family class I SAM-dependent RNA methyltransferase [Bdellovibrio svalbardensis]